MPKFEIGDLARVRENLTETEDTGYFPKEELEKFQGKIVRILNHYVDPVGLNLYYAERNNNKWWYHEEWLEPVYVDRTITIKASGDEVVATVRYEDHTSKPITMPAKSGIKGFYAVARELIKECKQEDEREHGPARKYSVGDKVYIDWNGMVNFPRVGKIIKVDRGPTEMPYMVADETGAFWCRESDSNGDKYPGPYILREVDKG